jgi:hypothetical protein
VESLNIIRNRTSTGENQKIEKIAKRQQK